MSRAETWLAAADLLRDYAKAAKNDRAAAESPVLKLVAEIRASVLEDMARVLEANGREDRTDPAIVIAREEP